MRRDDREDESDERGLSRRGFLRAGAGGLGMATLGLPRPGTRLPGGPRSDGERSLILLLLVGGPSQLETFDPKPDAPTDIRGPFGSIATRVPGIRVSEHLPRLADRMDRVALVRSVHHDAAPVHEAGMQLLQTGRIGAAGEEWPHFGSVAASVLGESPGGPATVILPGPIVSTGVEIPHGQSGGWLRPGAEPVFRNPDEYGRTRDAYGSSVFGRSCCTACRLIASGTRVVTINMFDTVFGGLSWDVHGASPFATFDDYAREVLPTFDRGFAAMLDDLEASGRLDSTLVVAAGEFGRTPRVNARGGRDHWPGVWTVAMAGGGVRGGRVIGASDRHAAEPADRPVTLPDLLATIYRSLGIDYRWGLMTADGRERPIVAGGEPIHELFA